MPNNEHSLRITIAWTIFQRPRISSLRYREKSWNSRSIYRNILDRNHKWTPRWAWGKSNKVSYRPKSPSQKCRRLWFDTSKLKWQVKDIKGVSAEQLNFARFRHPQTLLGGRFVDVEPHVQNLNIQKILEYWKNGVTGDPVGHQVQMRELAQLQQRLDAKVCDEVVGEIQVDQPCELAQPFCTLVADWVLGKGEFGQLAQFAKVLHAVVSQLVVADV